ncbi:MAG: response regulator transcription factor [Hyphomonadaceae bacterium]|nr:response regulator transcription factor [Hyphomonadaceae bacterium]
MNGARLLVVDDEPQLLRVLQPGLMAAGYDVEAAEDAQSALKALAATRFDLVILDLGLPDMDGKDLIKRLREWNEAPIIVLSARDAEQEKIEALDRGANDFVNKPFSIGELMARVRAVLRGREERAVRRKALSIGHVNIDFGARRLSVKGKEVRPSPREWRLLRAFAEHLEETLTHKQIVAAVWGPDEDIEAQFVRVLVGNLRQKIELDPSNPQMIVTETGVGYRMSAAAD